MSCPEPRTRWCTDFVLVQVWLHKSLQYQGGALPLPTQFINDMEQSTIYGYRTKRGRIYLLVNRSVPFLSRPLFVRGLRPRGLVVGLCASGLIILGGQ